MGRLHFQIKVLDCKNMLKVKWCPFYSVPEHFPGMWRDDKPQIMIFSQKLKTLNAQGKINTKTWSEFNIVITKEDDFYFLTTDFLQKKKIGRED